MDWCLLGVVDPSALLSKFGVDWHLLVIQSLNFLLVAYLLYRFAFKSIIQLMDSRREQIESGLVYAEKMKKEMFEFDKSREQRMNSVKKEAENIIKSAQNNAKTITEQEKQRAQQMADGMILAAEKEIALRQEKMVQVMKSEVGNLVVGMTKAVLMDEMTKSQRQSYLAAAEKALLSETLV